MKRQPITLRTRGGKTFQTTGYVRGALALHIDGFDGWRISHLATGTKVCEVATPNYKLLRRLATEVDWSGVEWADQLVLPPDWFERAAVAQRIIVEEL